MPEALGQVGGVAGTRGDLLKVEASLGFLT